MPFHHRHIARGPLAGLALLVLLPAACSQVALDVTGTSVIDAQLGTVDGMPSAAYRENGVFEFSSIHIHPAGTLTFTSPVPADLRSLGDIIIEGTIDLDGADGGPSGNNMPGAPETPGVAGGGNGGSGACATAFEQADGQRGGGSQGGFGGEGPVGGPFGDNTGGGGGGNGSAGTDSDPPPGGGTAIIGMGGCAYGATVVVPLVGGSGGGGGGCDLDAGVPTAGGSNDGGASGGAGGGGLALRAATNIDFMSTGSFSADGGDGGTSSGNGASGGGGSGGTLILEAMMDITFDGTVSAVGAIGGAVGQPGATSGGGDGGDGIVAMYDSDGVIAGSGSSTPVFTSATTLPSLPLHITTWILPNASTTGAYAATLEADGGLPAYAWAITGGALPGGITLDSMTGALTGTSTDTGGTSASFDVEVTDATMATYTRTFCMQTNRSDLAITTQSLPPADPMATYSQFVQTTGGTTPLTWTLQTGTLPAGLTLDTATGEIMGTTGNPESAIVTIIVEDSNYHFDSATYRLDIVTMGPRVSPSTLPNGMVAVPYSEMLTATGGTPPYTMTHVGGMLPPGTMFDSPTMTLSGTPTLEGVYGFDIEVTDSTMLTRVTRVSVTIDPAPAPTCTLTGPSGVERWGITAIIDTASFASSTVDILVEYSLNGGITWLPCTADATSPNPNPAMGVGVGMAMFVWDSAADMVGDPVPATGVLLQASITDGISPFTGTCTSTPFDVDNTAICTGICGDCDLNGMGPNVMDALEAAMISAGVTTPSFTQTGCCDVDRNIVIDIVDALQIAQDAAGLMPVLACP